MKTIGLDLGGTKCLGVVVGDDGRVLDEHRVPTPRNAGAGAVLDAMTSVGRELIGRAAGDVAAVGAGVPGLVDALGTLRYAPNLPGVTEVEVAPALAAALGLPIVVDNDASCAGWAERTAAAGAAAGHDHVVLVTLGTGIGGGIIIDGRLYRGANGFAGEIGHMVVDPDGPPCPCGQRGCWERYASGSGLARLAGERGEDVTAAARNGDAWAVKVLAEFAWWIALGLANLANVFDPTIFVLAGGLIEAGDVLLEPVRSSFATLVEAVEHRPPIAIVPASLGEHAGAIGAALLARDLAGG